MGPGHLPILPESRCLSCTISGHRGRRGAKMFGSHIFQTGGCHENYCKHGFSGRRGHAHAHAPAPAWRGIMTGDDEMMSMRAIEITRSLCRRAAIECQAHGFSPEDVSVASLYAAHDIAQNLKRDPFAAIEWM